MFVQMDYVEDHHAVRALESLPYGRSERPEVAEILLDVDGTYDRDLAAGDFTGQFGSALDAVAVGQTVVHCRLAALSRHSARPVHLVLGHEGVVESGHIYVQILGVAAVPVVLSGPEGIFLLFRRVVVAAGPVDAELPVGRIPGSRVVAYDQGRVDFFQGAVCLDDEIVYHHSPPFDPLLCVFSQNPAVAQAALRVVPAEYVLGEVFHRTADVAFEETAGQFAEIGCDAVVADAVENETVAVRIALYEFLEYVQFIFLNLRVGRIQHAVVIALYAGDGHQAALVVADALP